MLVTHQLQGRFSVTNTKFTRPVHQARTALVDLFDYRIHHTLRAGNKAADWLANYAMDHRSSVTSATAGTDVYYTILSTLDPLVRVDTEHPWSAYTPQSDVLTNIQAIIAAQDPPIRGNDHDHYRFWPRAAHQSPIGVAAGKFASYE